jgi:glycosyltransferase involved in cell wall biosynthesis
MKILMVNVYGHVTGGADSHCFALANALEAKGHEVVFLCTESPLNVVKRGRFVPCTVTHETRDALPARERASVAWKAIWNVQAADATRALIDEFQPDLLHAHKLYNQLSVAPVVVASQAGIPIVQTLHDYEFISASPFDHRGRWRDRDESTFSYRVLNNAVFMVRRHFHRPRVSAWISVSKYVAERHAAHGITSTVLPNFVSGMEAEPGSGFEQRRGAVFVGRLTPQKGVHDVLALAEAEPELPITVVGAGQLADEDCRLASTLPNLNFAGFVSPERVIELLSSARVHLMPSRWQEPGPMAPLEAMAVGTPVVAYRNGGLADYVQGSGGGRVVEPSLKNMQQACAELVRSRVSWDACSEAGRRAVRSTHSVNRYVDRIEEIYREVCAIPTGRARADAGPRRAASI